MVYVEPTLPVTDGAHAALVQHHFVELLNGHSVFYVPAVKAATKVAKGMQPVFVLRTSIKKRCWLREFTGATNFKCYADKIVRSQAVAQPSAKFAEGLQPVLTPHVSMKTRAGLFFFASPALFHTGRSILTT